MADGSTMNAGGDMYLVRVLFNQETQVYRCDGWGTEEHGPDVARWGRTRRMEEAWPIRVRGELLGFAALADTVGHAAALLHDIRAQHTEAMRLHWDKVSR